MSARWIGCVAENFHKGRPAGQTPQLIVLHTLDGSLEKTMVYQKPGAAESMHYVVAADGSVFQYVTEEDTAFHAGWVVNPTNDHVLSHPNVNPNFYSIGIAAEGRRDAPLPGAQTTALATLLAGLASRWRIPLDVGHVIPHSAVRSSAKCPGAAVDIAPLLEQANRTKTHSEVPLDNTVKTRVNANLRREPSRAGAVVRVIPANTAAVVTRFVEGELVAGNRFWYQDDSGNYLWAGATDAPSPIVDPTGGWNEPGVTDEMDNRIHVDRTLALAPGDYCDTKTPKNLIMLHFTAGKTADGAVSSWRSDPRRIATAYVVEDSGTIYQCFDPAFWAFHLGFKGTSEHDKRSIGIEICNVGPLRPAKDNPNVLNWWPRDFGTRFCDLSDSKSYVKASYRDDHYFAAFPEKQTAAVADLVRHLCDRFSIPKTTAEKERIDKFDVPFFKDFKGIATHANFREDKTDIGPAFEWGRLDLTV